MTVNSIELFTGAGGLAMGMQFAGCHVEILPTAICQQRIGR